MPKLNLEEVKSTIKNLSVRDRLELFRYISDLPDSGIHSGNLFEPPYQIQSQDKVNEIFEYNDEFVIIHSDPKSIPETLPLGLAVLFKGKTIFQVYYYPKNFYEGRLKLKNSWQNADPTESLIRRIRSIVESHGSQIPDEKIIEASQYAIKEIFEAHTFRITNEISDRLPDIVGLLINATVKIIEISISNSFAGDSGQFNKTHNLEDIEKLLEPYWKHIKDKHLNITQGGARNYKHIWSLEDRFCLKTNFDRLKPVWIEAKRIAKQAQKSKESSRRSNWRDEVLRTYPELPTDLLERLAIPLADDSKPSDLALINAARLCIPVEYSPRLLRTEIKKVEFQK